MSEIPPLDEAPKPPSAPTGLPWEEPNAQLGSIFKTAMQIIASPIEAFSRMSLTVDLVRPIAYFVLWALLAACVSQLWGFLLFDSMEGIVRSLAGPQFEKLAPFIQRPGALQLILGLVITPLVTLIALFVWSAIVHVVLTLLGGANRGFAATLRVMCYSQTTQVTVVIPLLGGLIGFVWRLILEIIGLSQAHKTEPWKATIAVTLPILLCCLCIVGAVVTFGAALGQFLQQLK